MSAPKSSWADAGDDPDSLAETLQKKASLPQQDDKDEDDADPRLISRTVGLIESTQEAQIQSDSPLESASTFPELGLRKELLDGAYGMNYNKPSKIQGLAIPAILKNPPHNFIGQAQSGTGKTAAFSLSLLSRVDEGLNQVQAMCVAPTRELARQIHQVVVGLAKFTKISALLAVPDMEIPKRITSHVVIGTTGKIESLIKTKAIDLKHARIFVLDEADEMLKLQGLQNQSMKIRQRLPKTCQICLFSATYNDEVTRFAAEVVPEPKITIYIPPEKLTLDKLAQFYIDCGSQDRKKEVLDEIYGYVNVGQSIIFVQTRETAKMLCDYMTSKKHEVSLLHGADMDSKERDRVIDSFRAGTTRVLITTNVLARGVDVLQVTLVINYDVPLTKDHAPDPENYLHRIGRSARFGNSGVAINFVHDEKSRRDLRFISEHFKKTINPIAVDNLEYVGELLDKLA